MKIAFYKGTPKGWRGLYSRGVRIVTKGHYSHCEVIFKDGVSASSSIAHGGVRFALVTYNDAEWDFVEVPDALEADARHWFFKHQGDKYDFLGNIHFVIPVVGDEKKKWCCSEAVGEALGLRDAWRFNPNSLYAVLASFRNSI